MSSAVSDSKTVRLEDFRCMRHPAIYADRVLPDGTLQREVVRGEMIDVLCRIDGKEWGLRARGSTPWKVLFAQLAEALESAVVLP